MSNYPNMSYCRYQNTVLAMQQILEDLSVSNEDENSARDILFSLCNDFINSYENTDWDDDIEEDDDEDDDEE